MSVAATFVMLAQARIQIHAPLGTLDQVQGDELGGGMR